jgi:uncharacterized membrane protein YjjP (DUF1212 family)
LLARPHLRHLFDLTAGFIAAAVTVACAAMIGPVSIRTSIVCGVIVLVPGLTLTLAMNELATRNLASGPARLMGAPGHAHVSSVRRGDRP